jgi:hypothetical protein
MDANPDAATDCADVALAVAHACGDEAGEAHAINAQAACIGLTAISIQPRPSFTSREHARWERKSARWLR